MKNPILTSCLKIGEHYSKLLGKGIYENLDKTL